MIYLMKQSTSKILGAFDTIALAKQFLVSHGITDHTPYLYLRRIEDMSYISRICYVDSVCVYNNKNYWLTESHSILDDYASHEVLDFFGEAVNQSRYEIEMNNNCMRLNNVYTPADEVAYNVKVGFEFISLFRQECITSDLGSQSGMDIAQATMNLIPLVMTGSFNEARIVLRVTPRDDFLTEQRMVKYEQLLAAADVITYMG